MNSVRKQLEDYLRDKSPLDFASGTLQRFAWKNKNGTLATPRSIVRRLEELAEDKILIVFYENGSARYRWNDGTENPERKKVQVVEQLPTGAVKISYV